MSNLATLQTAPPFTSETAKVYSKMALEARRAKIKQRQINLARPAIEPEINRIVRAMSKLTVSSDEYARLAGILDKLWSKAFPTQGAARPGRNRDRQPMAAPMPQDDAPQPQTPQPVVASPDKQNV